MIFISFEKECFNDTVLDLQAVGKLTEVKVPPESKVYFFFQES